MIAFDLPTYPIADAMVLGNRTLEEYQWLIDRGIFTFWNNKHMIRKVSQGHYQLLRNTMPIPELEAEAPTLDALIKLHDLPIRQYQWHPNWEDEPA
jgi:hypothetical protein